MALSCIFSLLSMWYCRKSKDRQYNSRKKNDKRKNNDLQNITHETKDWARY